jgi:hypothetical protein
MGNIVYGEQPMLFSLIFCLPAVFSLRFYLFLCPWWCISARAREVTLCFIFGIVFWESGVGKLSKKLQILVICTSVAQHFSRFASCLAFWFEWHDPGTIICHFAVELLEKAPAAKCLVGLGVVPLLKSFPSADAPRLQNSGCQFKSFFCTMRIEILVFCFCP